METYWEALIIDILPNVGPWQHTGIWDILRLPADNSSSTHKYESQSAKQGCQEK